MTIYRCLLTVKEVAHIILCLQVVAVAFGTSLCYLRSLLKDLGYRKLYIHDTRHDANF